MGSWRSQDALVGTDAELYRIAAEKRDVFVNSAFIELFGLTAIEASATGLPFVATHDGGPGHRRELR